MDYCICMQMLGSLDLWIITVLFSLKTICNIKKKLLRKAEKPASQIARTILEKRNVSKTKSS